jgi:hypothetical protein
MKALIKNENKMNNYEIENKRASYKTLVEYFIGDIVLCNNIQDIDESIWENVIIGNLYNEEYDEYIEIFQFYLCNVNEFDIKYLKELTKDNNDIILSYSDTLDCNVLMVDHYGTSWSYVLTSVPLVETYEELEELEKGDEE